MADFVSRILSVINLPGKSERLLYCVHWQCFAILGISLVAKCRALH